MRKRSSVRPEMASGMVPVRLTSSKKRRPMTRLASLQVMSCQSQHGVEGVHEAKWL